MEQVNKLPDRLGQFIGIVFAMVVANSFAMYSTLILHPENSPLGFVGLLAVYVTIISSWVRYNQKASKYPYRENGWGWFRLGGDFLIVGLYAYLLFSLTAVQQDGNLARYLWGFTIIFFVYILVGVLRIKEHSTRKASNTRRLVFFFSVFFVTAATYQLILPVFYPTVWEGVNWIFLIVPPALNLLFTKEWWRER